MQGHFAPFNCLVLGHAKYKGVQRVYSKIFPKKMFHGSPSMDPVIIRPPGVLSLYRLRQYGMLFHSGTAWVRSPPTPTHKTFLLSAVGDLK
jgi:hypothetical protein